MEDDVQTAQTIETSGFVAFKDTQKYVSCNVKDIDKLMKLYKDKSAIFASGSLTFLLSNFHESLNLFKKILHIQQSKINDVGLLEISI